jgi:nicotinic acetylcholine receptor, invertebrate
MVNLIVPCVSMSFLTVLVFSLSSNSGEKITLCISILLALTLFFLLLLDIMPPTSLVVPLLGKYLVFTITMVSLSICVTIYILNIHFRTPQLYNRMPNIIRKIFLIYLPRLLLLNNINDEESNERRSRMGKRRRDAISMSKNNKSNKRAALSSTKNESHVEVNYLSNYKAKNAQLLTKNALLMREAKFRNECDNNNVLVIIEKESSPIFTIKKRQNKIDFEWTQKKKSKPNQLINQFHFKLSTLNLKYVTEIADFMKSDYNMRMLIHEWKLLALVLDRLMFCIFCFAFIFGTFFIFLQSPTLYSINDANGQPIDSLRLKNYCDLND